MQKERLYGWEGCFFFSVEFSCLGKVAGKQISGCAAVGLFREGMSQAEKQGEPLGERLKWSVMKSR